MGIIRPLLVAGVFTLAAAAQSQTPAAGAPKLTARELFYAAPEAAKPRAAAPKAATSTKRAPSTSQTIQTPETRSVDTPQQNSAPSSSVPIIAVSDTGPLGLRYTILQQSGGQSVEVTPDTVFHSGDRIRFRVEANGDGYLYIVAQGTSGTWSVLFPSPEIENGDNRVHRGGKYTVPSEETFSFEGAPGTEKLFVVLSRQPEKELDSLFYSLKQKTDEPKAPAAEPGARMLMASNNVHIGDDVIGRLRNALVSRDLIIEKASQEEPAAKGDKAVYVVNPRGSAAARVVADVPLTHR